MTYGAPLWEEQWTFEGHLEGRIGDGPWEILVTALELREAPSPNALLFARRTMFRDQARDLAEDTASLRPKPTPGQMRIDDPTYDETHRSISEDEQRLRLRADE